MAATEYPVPIMEHPLCLQLLEELLQTHAGVRSSLFDRTLQLEQRLHVQCYIQVMIFLMLSRLQLFSYQSFQSKSALRLLQYIDRVPADKYDVTLKPVTKITPMIDPQCLLLMNDPQASLEMAIYHSVGANIKSTSTQPSLISARTTPTRSQLETSPLPNSTIVCGSCDHNGGVISSEDGIKITVPEGAIKSGDLVTFHIAAGLFGPFVLLSKCQANLASPYYWIGVSGSYHFHKPVQVEFEHFGACDPSHYQLLCCEDDDESCTLRPVDYELNFEERDGLSLCTFYTHHFCSYCLYHGCKDPKISRIVALYLRPTNFQYLNYFTVEIWFSLPISYCLKRSEELFRMRSMSLESSSIFVAPSKKHSTIYFTLNYDKEINGWSIHHSRSTIIKTTEVNFYNYNTNAKDLQAMEEASLFPPRFVINVSKKSDCNTELNTGVAITLRDGNEDKKSLIYRLFAPVPTRTSTDFSKDTSLLFVCSHHCEDNKPKLKDLKLYLKHISSNWRQIASHLGIPKHHISTINIDHPFIKDKCSTMFRVWLERTTSPCWCHFVEALIDCGLHGVAEEAKKHLQISPSNVTMGSPDTGKGSLKNNSKEKLQKETVQKSPSNVNTESPNTSKGSLYTREELQKSNVDIDEHKQVSVAALDDLKKPAPVPAGADTTAETGNVQFTVNSLMQLSADLEAVCPLKGSKVMLHTCDYNGGIFISKDGSLKITVPRGAIRRGDLVLFATATDLFGSFVLPSKCEADLASPYYWIRVTESYRFQKPVQVQFEHFAVVTACDPSHYQLLCCEDDDEDHIMQPAVEHNLDFTVRGDISLCIFQTQHFCSCCLRHNCKDPMINMIGAYYLKPENFQTFDHFSVEIWFSLPISHCSKRNRELYTKRKLVLQDVGYIFEAACHKNSTSYFFLEYETVDDWGIDHSLSNKIPTKKVNFHNYNYKNSEDLRRSEEDSLFPPCFIINVVKSSKCTTDLNANIIISLYDDEGKQVDSTQFKLFVPISVLTPTGVSTSDCTAKSPIIGHHCCENNRPKLVDLSKYKTNISNRWKEVALNLGIPEDKVSTINTNNSVVEDKCYDMFKTWLDSTISACWCQFIQALCARDVGLPRVAVEVREHLTYGSASTASSDRKDEQELFLNDIPEYKLNYFITRLLPKQSAINVIKDIKCNPGSKEDNIKKVYEEFLKQEDPSWTKIHQALKEAKCDDLADTFEASFSPG